MMITIHGLPLGTKYQEVKSLIKQECNITDFILDYLVNDTDGSKKVRVGLADDTEGNHLIKCLDGFRMSGNVLRLVPFGKSAVTNAQQPNTFDMRANYQRPDYPNQYNDRNVQPMESLRPTPWANNGNQWSSNQPQAPVQNTYGLQQQPMAPYIQQQANPIVKPNFEPREGILARATQNPTFGFPPKSNLISLGPQRNIQSNLRELPEATNRPTQPGRYQSQNYVMPSEKPMTIMKDNFQGPSQYSVNSIQNVSSNFLSQNQPSPWTSQHQQQNYEKSVPVFDKKPYEDRKYPVQIKSEMSKSDDHYRYEKSSRDFSPQRRSVRESDERRGSPGRRISPSGKQISYSDRHISSDRRVPPSSERHISPDRRVPPSSGRHISPDRRVPSSSGRQVSPSGRHVSSSGRRDSPPRRQMSPSGRHVSSIGRHASPSARQVSPSGRHVVLSSRHISPPGRRISPTDRHISSIGTSKHMSDRRFSPSGRQIPMERKISPTRKLSPQMRKEDYLRGRRTSPPAHSPMDRRPNRQSPGRDSGMATHLHESPRRQSRYSPSRNLGKPMNYQDERNIKDVRPAYEPQSQASNEAMYSDGYRPNVREETKYQSRQEHWQARDNFSSKSVIEDRRAVQRMQQYDRPRIMDQSKEHELRRSRSPKRDRSPLRDRYKRHSPSPRSPRRSWALEKRRSPEVREPPPPPIWPQEREEYKQKTRLKFGDPVVEKNSPVWETREKKRDDVQIADERRNLEEPRRKEVQKWKPIPTSNPSQTSSRFDNSKSSRPELEDRRDYTHLNHPRSARRERDDLSYKPEFVTKDDMPRKIDYCGRIEDKKKEILVKQEQLQKEIEEVYKRAVDFSKKAEMYKKSEHKKESSYDEDRRRIEGRDDSTDFHRKRESYEKDRREDDFNKDYGKSHFSRKEDVHRSDEFTSTRHEPEGKQKLRFHVSSAIKAKRNKAVEEISEKMMCKYGDFLPKEVKDRVMNELQWTLRRKLFDMFEDNDVSFIEMVVKFNTRHTQQDEKKIFSDVIASLPSYYKNLKRPAKDDSDIPTKSSGRSREPSLNEDIERRESSEKITDWDISTFPQTMPIVPSMSLITAPVMVPMPAQYQMVPTYQQMPQVVEETKKDGYTLYLCKHDFQPMYEYETDLLKNFLIQKLIKVTETSQGWAPDFTLNKQHSTYRHEVVTRDERSKDWLLSLDFSEFMEFDVLVYTTEELWFERAAIWLPGHSRSRNMEPLVKLKLQNNHLEGVNIGKWKIVKKIVTQKGTRLYVDMPPVCARALEKYKMTLSFELQKVNVFLKAVAIDKNAFDAGLNETSIEVLPSPGSDPMPSVNEHPDLIKMAFKGNKPLPLARARQLKDIILYKMYKYLELNGKSRTDFLKYGLCQGGFFGILPENEESKRWLCSLDLGKIQRVPIIILGADGSKTKYIKMIINMPKDYQLNTSLAMERIRQSNRGVKGLNFSLWKNQNLVVSKKRVMIELDMDIDSVETISKMNFQLDYVLNGVNSDSLKVESGYSNKKLEDIIAKHKAEMSDSYDVANMDIATDSEEEVICLD